MAGNKKRSKRSTSIPQLTTTTQTSMSSSSSSISTHTFKPLSTTFITQTLETPSGFAQNENEINGFKFSHPSSPNPCPNSSDSVTPAVRFTIPLLPGIDVEDLLDEKPSVEEPIGRGVRMLGESPVQVPSVIGESGAMADLFSMNFSSSRNVERDDGRVRGMGGFENVLRSNQCFGAAGGAGVPMVQSQPGGFIDRWAEVKPTIPKMTNYLGAEPFGNPYRTSCLSYNNIHMPSAATSGFKRKIDVYSNSCNAPNMDSLFGQIPGGTSQSLLVPHNSLFPIAARGKPVSYISSPLFNIEATENQDMHFFSTAGGSWKDTCTGSTASVPMSKMKEAHPRFSSGTSVTVVPDGYQNDNSEPSDKQVPLLHEHISLDATPFVQTSWIPCSSELHSGNLSSASSYRPEDDKEVEGKGWILLVQKELRNTDVGSLGRIVLPKKEAETNLPHLDANNRLILQMDDMTYAVTWNFKYRYWPNNKSRMYVMENTGDFVKMHNLQTGDYFIVYKEVSSGRYIVRGKKEARPLCIEDMVDQKKGRSEDRETWAASPQSLSEQGNSASNDGILDLNAEQVIATGEPFDFVEELDSRFFHLPLPDTDAKGGLR